MLQTGRHYDCPGRLHVVGAAAADRPGPAGYRGRFGHQAADRAQNEKRFANQRQWAQFERVVVAGRLQSVSAAVQRQTRAQDRHLDSRRHQQSALIRISGER